MVSGMASVNYKLVIVGTYFGTVSLWVDIYLFIYAERIRLLDIPRLVLCKFKLLDNTVK